MGSFLYSLGSIMFIVSKKNIHLISFVNKTSTIVLKRKVRTNNTMAKKETKGQTMNYETPHRKQKVNSCAPER